jgi:hypothetical protein
LVTRRAFIRLRRFWDRPSGATCNPDDLHDLLWTNTRTFKEGPWFGPKMLTAMVSCDRVDGIDEIHLAEHGPCPHQIRVIIAAKDNPRAEYRRLRDRPTAR